MFFSTELLSRRDSGFGLLWLAATLGAKSSLKKLPKRSVLTADITELCKLIVEPPEPMALRLSSNLMVGVVRVYTVKQEILMSDVQTCFNTLKKAVHDLHSMAAASNAQLQMGQGTMRPDALTLAAQPDIAFALDFDNILANWDDIAEPQEESDNGSDDDYSKSRRGRGQRARRVKPQSLSLAEHGRAAPHTLDESHDYLLSNPLDVSFGDGGPGGVPSSSQFGGAFGLDDNLFAGGDVLDLPGMDDLARELGWDAGGDRLSDDAPMDIPMDPGPDVGMDPDFQFGEGAPAGITALRGETPESVALGKRARDSDKENQPPEALLSPISSQPPAAPEEKQPLRKRAKRVRLLVDARTELTDDELRSARASYVEDQESLRRELERKQAEKDSAKMVEDLLWGAPPGLHAPALADLWSENFRVQVEARTGAIRLHTDNGQRSTKRTKRTGPAEKDTAPPWDIGSVAPRGGISIGAFGDYSNMGEITAEEPEFPRNVSRPPSLIGSVGGRFGSVGRGSRQESFGWDAPAASSSVIGGAFDPGDFGTADVGLLSRSAGGSRRSSVLPGPFGSGVGASPAYADFGMPNTQMLAEDFGFALPGTQSAADSQLSDANLAALERNSLGYAKMQLQSMPVAGSLTFEEIVPKSICTAHVASSVFYHCLVLATKNLVAVEQPAAYGTIKLTKRN